MKTRSTFPKIPIAVVTVILLLFFSLWWFKGKSTAYLVTGGVKRNPQAAMFVGKDSPVMVSLLINPEKLTSLSQLLPSNREQKRVLTAVKQLQQNLLIQAQVDPNEELKKWLGDEITLAVTSLDLDHNIDNGVKPGYLLVIKNKDKQLAREFLQSYYSQQAVSQSAELIFEQYQGVNLVYQRPLLADSKIKQVAAAVVDDFVLFANDLLVLKEAINDAQAIDRNLAHDSAYRKAITTINQPKVSLAYFNLPSTSAWIANQASVADSLIQQTLTVSLTLNRHGLITHTALFGVEGAENRPPSLSTPPTVLKYVPDDTIFAAVGVNLNQFWQQITVGLPEDSPLKQIIYQAINPIESSLELNFAEDIFNQVTGEYALSFSEDKVTEQLDWLFINQIEAEQSLTKNLDSIAQNRGLSVGKLPLDETTMTAWTKLVTTSENNFSSLSAEVKGVYSDIDSYQLITNSVNILSDTVTNRSTSLSKNPQFQDTLKALPKKNDGYLYLDWQKSEPYLAKRFPLIRFAELAFKPLFDNLQTLTVTSEGAENGIRRATMFFNLLD